MPQVPRIELSGRGWRYSEARPSTPQGPGEPANPLIKTLGQGGALLGQFASGVAKERADSRARAEALQERNALDHALYRARLEMDSNLNEAAQQRDVDPIAQWDGATDAPGVRQQLFDSWTAGMPAGQRLQFEHEVLPFVYNHTKALRDLRDSRLMDDHRAALVGHASAAIRVLGDLTQSGPALDGAVRALARSLSVRVQVGALSAEQASKLLEATWREGLEQRAESVAFRAPATFLRMGNAYEKAQLKEPLSPEEQALLSEAETVFGGIPPEKRNRLAQQAGNRVRQETEDRHRDLRHAEERAEKARVNERDQIWAGVLQVLTAEGPGQAPAQLRTAGLTDESLVQLTGLSTQQRAQALRKTLTAYGPNGPAATRDRITAPELEHYLTNLNAVVEKTQDTPDDPAVVSELWFDLYQTDQNARPVAPGYTTEVARGLYKEGKISKSTYIQYLEKYAKRFESKETKSQETTARAISKQIDSLKTLFGPAGIMDSAFKAPHQALMAEILYEFNSRTSYDMPAARVTEIGQGIVTKYQPRRMEIYTTQLSLYEEQVRMWGPTEVGAQKHPRWNTLGAEERRWLLQRYRLLDQIRRLGNLEGLSKEFQESIQAPGGAPKGKRRE